MPTRGSWPRQPCLTSPRIIPPRHASHRTSPYFSSHLTSPRLPNPCDPHSLARPSDEPDDPLDDEVHHHLSEDQIYPSDEDRAVLRISEQESPLFQNSPERESAGIGAGAGGGGRPGMLRQDTPSPKVFTGRKRVDKKNMLGVVIDKVSSTRVRAQTAVVCCRVVWTRLRRLYALLQFLPTLKRTTHNFVRLRRFQDAPVVLCNGESDSPVGPPDVARTRVNLDGNGKISNRHSTGEALGSNAATVVAPKRSSAPSMARLKRPSGGTDINSGVDSGFAASSGAGGGAEADGEDDAVPKRTARAATTIDLPPTIDPDGPELPNFADPDGPPIPDFSGWRSGWARDPCLW